MKKIYEAPTVALTLIFAADIITVSLSDLNVDWKEDTFDTGIADIVIG